VIKPIMNELTFEQLPKAVGEIKAKLDSIERLLQDFLSRTPPIPKPNEYINIKQLAEILSLSIPTLYGYVHNRKIPCYKRGQRLYFSREEINNWLSIGRIKTMDEIAKEADEYLTRKRRK